MTLPVRISALMSRAAGDTGLARLLDLYALSHPGLRLVRGTAWAGPVDQPAGSDVTFEIREQSGTGADLTVVGRVTLQAGVGQPLPAPGPVVQVPDATSAGDLIIRLRWGTPDLLRATGSRHHGDVAWRVERGMAEARLFQATPPTAAQLDGLAVSNPGQVSRLAGPIFAGKLFTPAEAPDLVADPATFYALDDNQRGAPGGAPAAEGAQYYYFVAAADPLGRPGQVSPGLLATFCRRLPPEVPHRLRVADRWSAAEGPRWDVSWETILPGVGTPVTRYELFRGNDLKAHAAAQQGKLDLDAPVILPAEPDAIQRIATLDDPGATTPTLLQFSAPVAGNPGSSWWFAVRAVHQGPPGCPSTASPLSPPTFGRTANRKAPLAPDPEDIAPPGVECLLVGCVRDQIAADEVSPDPLDLSEARFIARATRHAGIDACRFRVLDVTDGTTLVPESEVVFAEGEDSVSITWGAPLSSIGHQFDVQCAAVALGSILSSWAHSASTGILPDGDHRMAHHFLAGAIAKSELAEAPAGDPLWSALPFMAANPWPTDLHLAASPYSGRIFHPKLCLALAPGAEQYRVYRRVDSGPLSLVLQGIQKYVAPGCALTVEDPAPPVSNGPVEYFLQLLDENGHASAMRRLAMLRFTGVPPPAPVLITPESSDFGGSADAPTVNLSWVCPPEHVERFEVLVLTDKASNDPEPAAGSAPGSAKLLTPKAGGVASSFKLRTRTDSVLLKEFRVQPGFLTGRVGGDLGPGPRFTVPMKLNASLKYTVWVRALGPNNEQSGPSRTIEFQWQAPLPPLDDIPWPARPLPPVAAWNPGIQPVDFASIPAARLLWSTEFLNNAVGGGTVYHYSVDMNATPVGIRIGAIPMLNLQGKVGFATSVPAGPLLQTPQGSPAWGKGNPNQQVYPREGAPSETLLPAVLYRQQVANDNFPNVSGDVIQCSPLIRGIAWESATINARGDLSKLTDPFFAWVGPDPRLAPTLELYLLDTQPVVTGARYRYWLMRFSLLGEPIQTVPCGEVTIQPAP